MGVFRSGPKRMSPPDFFEHLRRGVGFSIIAVAFGHVGEGRVSLCLAGVPVPAFPVLAEKAGQCVARRQRHANTVVAIAVCGLGVEQIVRMTIVHISRSIDQAGGVAIAGGGGRKWRE